MINLNSNNNSLIPSSVGVQSGTESAKQDPTFSLSITPDQDNVSTGDKSSNSVSVSLSTPTNEVTTNVTREQAVNRIEKNLTRKAVESVLGVGRQGINPVRTAVVAKTISNGDIGSGELQETAVNLIEAKYKFQTAQFALNQFSNEPDNSSVNPSNNQPGFVNVASDATNFYIRSQLAFSTIDRLGEKINESF